MAWLALRYAAEELCADRKVATVSQSGNALVCAAEELRTDREMVLAAIEHDLGMDSHRWLSLTPYIEQVID